MSSEQGVGKIVLKLDLQGLGEGSLDMGKWEVKGSSVEMVSGDDVLVPEREDDVIVVQHAWLEGTRRRKKSEKV